MTDPDSGEWRATTGVDTFVIAEDTANGRWTIELLMHGGRPGELSTVIMRRGLWCIHDAMTEAEALADSEYAWTTLYQLFHRIRRAEGRQNATDVLASMDETHPALEAVCQLWGQLQESREAKAYGLTAIDYTDLRTMWDSYITAGYTVPAARRVIDKVIDLVGYPEGARRLIHELSEGMNNR